MSDSLYVKVGSTMEALDLGTGTAPEYVERIEALESGLETVSTEALGVKADTVLAAENAADVSGGSLGDADLNQILSAYEMTQAQVSALESSKADVSLANLSAAGKEVAAKASMPSGRYVELTLGASGTQYTAPADGWFVLRKASITVNQYMTMFNYTGGYQYSVTFETSITTHKTGGIIPMRKGDVLIINYSLTGDTEYFRFIYAEGAE